MSRPCWCGSLQLVGFDDDCFLCRSCSTLVSRLQPSEDLTNVHDQGELYGRDDYLSHLPNDLGLPDLETRTRDDLPERNAYWLRTLLGHRLPPADVLEVGCAHGGFVALMQWAGFNAAGLEFSPWLVDYARTTFGVPVHQGSLEQQQFAEGSLDVIVLMDVLEHLSDPVRTAALALRLLRPNGFLLIQTPCYPEGASRAEMTEHKAHFLDLLLPREHLYLFSRRAAREFFGRLGADHMIFVPSIFDYDIFFLVSREPLQEVPESDRRGAREASPSGRLVQALLHLFGRVEMQQIAADERLGVIHSLKVAVDERLQLIADLKAAADERLQIIQKLNSKRKTD